MAANGSDPLSAVVAKLLPIAEIYKDAAQPAAKELGKAGGDIVKAARLVTLPFQLLAMVQDNFDRYRARVNEQVPPERRQPIPPSLGVPILEALMFADEQALATDMMLNLLAAAMDKERVADVHPAFSRMARDLAPDEAMILYQLKKGPYRMQYKMDLLLAKETRPGEPVWGPKDIELNEFPLNQLAQPEYFSLYVDRLRLLGVASTDVIGNPETIWGEGDGKKRQVGIRHFGITHLTDFGKLFARACVPDELPLSHSQCRSP